MGRLSQLLVREPVRVYLYGVGVAGLLLLVAYGLVEDSKAPLWLGLLGAVLYVPGVELARARVTPVQPVQDTPPDADHQM